MRTFFVLICSLALAFAAGGAEEKKKEEKPAPKKPQTQEAAQASGGGRKAKATEQQTNLSRHTPEAQGASGEGKGKGTGATHGAEAGKHAEIGKAKGQSEAAVANNRAEVERKKAAKVTNSNQREPGKRKGTTKPGESGTTAQTGKPAQGLKQKPGGKAGAGGVAAGKPFKPQHFNVAKQPNTAKAPPVKFQQGKHIEGSQKWQGQQYSVFRNYKEEWHDENWWHNHHDRIVFVFGAPYYWNAGYWFPAWGYNPNAYYAWNGPIYAYNNLPPDQVIANVQSALQEQGYYHGEVDGLIGPLTRGAIADYQRDRGLYVTSAIDQPTLQSLGMA
jgi:Putative peptidoglycan binding domain